MSRNQITIVNDDLTGEEGAERVVFSLQGQTYEIDLTKTSYITLAKMLAPYMSAGRRLGKTKKAALRQSSRTDPAYLAAVRQWAAENDIALPKRGRIPGAVTEAYYEATRG